MPGVEVPASGDIGDDNVTNADQETNLENLASATRRVMGVGRGASSADVIIAGSITPDSGIVIVDTEGSVPADFLDVISQANYIDESLILVRAADAGRVVTLRHAQGGAGEFILANGQDFALSSPLHAIILRQDGVSWSEVTREYGDDLASLRAFMGLGSAAILNDGALDAATLGGLGSAAFLPVGGTAADSALLQGLAAAAFIRANVAALQVLLGGLRSDAGLLEANHPLLAGAPQLKLMVQGLARSQLFFDAVNNDLTLRLMDPDQVTILGGIRIRDGEIPEYWDKSGIGQWITFFDSLAPPFPNLNRINWDKLDAPILFPAGQYVLRSEAITMLPGTGANAILRITAGISARNGGFNGEFTIGIHVGNNGDETDLLIDESATLAAGAGLPSSNESQILGNEYTVPVGGFVTLVLNITVLNAIWLDPSLQETYAIDSRTFFRIEQIG